MMYSCGHNFQGMTVSQHWDLQPHMQMPLSTGLCPKCVEGIKTYCSTPFGYDVLDSQGTVLRHVTTGDVRCELGVCEHKEHQHG
jgi:hypothetical protein